ncbi:MAG: hypothetical protein IT585_02000 [candidate division Zixibacteria bacterium]|nr:hypothetical protein [candidate division Zixibacteria bacterium]
MILATATIEPANSAGELLTGAQCRALRLACRRTLREVGAEAGIHLEEVCAFESGRIKLGEKRLRRLQRALVVLQTAPRGGRVNPDRRVGLEEPLTRHEQWVFRRYCSRWTARGLGRLNVEKFAVAVNEILRRPVLYACIEPRATLSPVLVEGD